ncbi:MAG: hypothetical protein V3V79_00175 [Gammaproteobacteria bacterium]|jgi:hypothetical protein
MIGRPAVGLIALTVTFLGQPLARAVNRVLLAWLDDWAIVGFAGLGVVGVFVVATHLTAQENRASVAGFIGGLLIWRGFFDGPLRFFADWFSIQPVDFGGFPLGGRYALLMSSLTIMLAMLLLYGLMNRETKCLFMRFCLRLVHWSPGDPTPGLGRSYARIAAMETVFVQWGIFLLFLFLGGWLGMPFYAVMCLWSVYLIWQLLRRQRVGEAFRYAIPVSVVVWSLAEVAAFFGMFPEYWQAPAEHPFVMMLMLALFVAGLVLLLRGNRRSDG